MNEIVKHQDTQMATTSLSGIVPQTMDDAFRLGKAISLSGMTPYGMKTAEQCTVAILQGLEVGLPPMQAIQNIAVINGRPVIWGDASLAIVQKSGLCEWIEEEVTGEGDDMVATCTTQRRGSPKPIARTFSVADAIKARLWQTKARVERKSKSGGTYETDNDSPWYKYPKRMLQMRARAYCLRDVYPDALKGLQVREEVEDYSQDHRGPDNAKDVTQAPMAERYAEPEKQPIEGFDADGVTTEIEKIKDEKVETNNDLTGADLFPEEQPDQDGAESEVAPQPLSDDDSAPSEFPDPRDKLISYVRGLLKCIDGRGDTSLAAVSEHMKAISARFGAEFKSEYGPDAVQQAQAIHTSMIAIVKNMKDPEDGQERSVVLEYYAEVLDCEPADFEGKAA